MSGSLFFRSCQRWASSAKGIIATSQRGLSAIASPEKPKSVEVSSPESIKEGRLDQLYRYLWIKCIGHEIAVLDSYEKFVTMAAKHLEVDYVRTEAPYRFFRRRTLLASRHVHKKYRVQYEIRNYYRNLLFKNITESTADTFLEYIERNVPEGILLVVEKHRLGELPFDLEKN